MAISVLGPLRVTVAGRLVSLPAKQRTLLAILAFQANRSVSSDRLVKAIWGQDAAPSVTKTLQSHVFQLRRALASADDLEDETLRIITDGDGYRLAVDPAAIDAHVFPGLLEAAARAGPADPRCAVDLLVQALAMWRGPGGIDVGDDPAALAEIQLLEQLRVTAQDDVARLRLALGEHEAVIPDLRRAIAEAPYHEQLWASLMIALARSGSRTEALVAYRDAQRALRRELDIEPGPQLQALAASIRDGSTGPVAPFVGRSTSAPDSPSAPGPAISALRDAEFPAC